MNRHQARSTNFEGSIPDERADDIQKRPNVPGPFSELEVERHLAALAAIDSSSRSYTGKDISIAITDYLIVIEVTAP